MVQRYSLNRGVKETEQRLLICECFQKTNNNPTINCNKRLISQDNCKPQPLVIILKPSPFLPDGLLFSNLQKCSISRIDYRAINQ